MNSAEELKKIAEELDKEDLKWNWKKDFTGGVSLEVSSPSTGRSPKITAVLKGVPEDLLESARDFKLGENEEDFGMAMSAFLDKVVEPESSDLPVDYEDLHDFLATATDVVSTTGGTLVLESMVYY